MSTPVFNAVQAHVAAGRLEQARALVVQALARSPRDAQLLGLAAWVFLQLGQLGQARYSAERAIEAGPASADAHFNLGKILVAMGLSAEAVESFRRAVAAAPDDAEMLSGLTNALYAASWFDECIAQCREGLERWPDHPHFLTDLALSLTGLGRAGEALPLARRAAAAHPDDAGCVMLLPHIMNYAAESDPAEARAAHEAYGRLVDRLHPPRARPPIADPDPDRPLRIGLISGDLRLHAVGTFIAPFLEHHDRRALHITCYSTTAAEDSGSKRLRSMVEAWRPVGALPVPALAERIAMDKIDILIDLSGHTGGNRLQVFALHPAPIGVTGFGYPNTTGVRGVLYRLVDSLTDPDESWYDSLNTERLCRLDPCFLCYVMPAGAPAPSAPPSASGAPFTFGSFNNIAKQSDASLALYRRVLDAVPGSRLLLKYITLAHESTRRALADRCAAVGIDRSRLLIESPEKTSLELMAAYGRMDVMLDSYPYHGTTTTCEALSMGVPVVTLAGRVSAARVGVSLLTNVGLPELVAATPEEYAAAAARLAGDRAALAELRGGLRGRLLASPLGDAPGYARRLEAALRGLWRAECGRG